MMGSWVTDALGHGGGFAFPFSIEGCWPEAKLQPPRHSVPSPPPGASLGAMFSLCSLFLSCRVVLRVHSAIPACLRVREGLPDSPGLSASWGLAVAAFLRILSMLFPLDQDTLRELWSYSHWVSEGSLAASRAPTPRLYGEAQPQPTVLCAAQLSLGFSHLGRFKERRAPHSSAPSHQPDHPRTVIPGLHIRSRQWSRTHFT